MYYWHIDVYFCQISIKLRHQKLINIMNFRFCVFKVLQCTFMTKAVFRTPWRNILDSHINNVHTQLCKSMHFNANAINVKQESNINSSQSKKEGKDQKSIQWVPHLAQDTIMESDKTQENIIYQKAKRSSYISESQEISPFPAGDHKATMTRQESMTQTNRKHK